ncbi:MAG: ribosome maturation factor RimP [Nitrospinota bacterium]|nr:ribosome maturation factor RimP [Nitrospinota bacterium]
MLAGELRGRLWPVVEPIVEDEGLELVEVEFVHQNGSWVLRIYMDAPGGVRIEDCERVSRRLSPVLDVENLIPHHYTLEVSSPGVPRPIRKARDFERLSGERARIDMALPMNGRKRFTGELAGVSGGSEPAVALALDDGEMVHLPLTRIKRAHQEIEI